MRGNRQALQWVVRGVGTVEIHWQCSRAGTGVERVSVGKEAIEQLTRFKRSESLLSRLK